MSLSTKTNKWVENKLISAEQAQAILAFEKSSHNNLFWKVAFVIAALLIGLGLILIVSSGWQNIPDLVKLSSAFLLLGGFSYATFWHLQKQHKGWKEFFAILSFLMIGATIGLIGQIFNLDGGWKSFALGWAILGLPFVLCSRILFFNIAWSLLLFSHFDISDLLKTLFDTLQNSILSTILLLLLSYAGGKLDETFRPYTLLAKAFEKLMLWAAYLSVFYIAGRWGLTGKWMTTQASQVWLANTFIFVFAAWRLFLAIRVQSITSFKRNALLTEIYIFLLFVFGVKNLFASGIGFILGGLLVLLLIYILRRTTQYIKQMEIFK